MGIKGWVSIGVGTLIVGGVAWFLKKKEDKFIENLDKIINEVDLKNQSPEVNTEEPKSVEMMEDEVNRAFAEMDISESEDSDTNEMATEQVETKTVAEVAVPADTDQIWKEKVRKAVDREDFEACRRLFNQKYCPYPYEPSAASVYGDAANDGVITREFEHKASEYYGNLWCYAGD